MNIRGGYLEELLNHHNIDKIAMKAEVDGLDNLVCKLNNLGYSELPVEFITGDTLAHYNESTNTFELGSAIVDYLIRSDSRTFDINELASYKLKLLELNGGAILLCRDSALNLQLFDSKDRSLMEMGNKTIDFGNSQIVTEQFGDLSYLFSNSVNNRLIFRDSLNTVVKQADYLCKAATFDELDLSTLNFKPVRSIISAFSQCKIKTLRLGAFDINNDARAYNIFTGSSIDTIVLDNNTFFKRLGIVQDLQDTKFIFKNNELTYNSMLYK